MKNDRIPTRGRASLLSGVGVLCAAALASGCMGSPTYGTGKTANQQLLEDISGSLTLMPNTGPEIAYRPRHELVRPASVDALPEPQQEIASAENPAWPESPEQRRARLRAEATENQDNPRYRPQIRSGMSGGGVTSPAAERGVPDAMASAAQREEFQRRLRESRQGEPDQRRYLSEPPIDYRRPSDTAPVDDLGEDERTKERRLRQAAGQGSSWRDFVPWL